MKKSLSSIIVLTVICLISAVLLSVTNEITAPIIKETEKKATREALLVVYPNGGSFEELSVDELNLPSSVIAAYKASKGGYVFKISTTGYSSGLQVLCAVGSDGSVTGAKCLASSETLGYEKTYGDSFKGVNSGSVDGVDTVAGATKTTTAYKKAIKDALSSWDALK